MLLAKIVGDVCQEHTSHKYTLCAKYIIYANPSGVYVKNPSI
jgi:hypothetical protein